MVALTVALCFLSGVVGYWIGAPDRDESFSQVDVGFLADMTAHHNSAVEMSLDVLGSDADAAVEHFARDILLSQTQEITVMNGLLASAGTPASASDDLAMEWMGRGVAASEMPGVPSPADAGALAAATGPAVDELFTTLMIRHHAAGVSMAEYTARHGSNGKVRRLASAMAAVQRREINEMNARRRVLGLAPVIVELGDAPTHPAN